MPTDLMAALDRRARLERERGLDRCSEVLLVPLAICLVTLVLAIESPVFAAAMAATGLN
jgi:hypothetical protein